VTKYSPDAGPERRLPLNEKVGRILHTLARSSFSKAPPESDPLDISEEVVTGAIRAWRDRACYLPAELFSDPAWGMLLELLQAEIGKRRVTVSGVCKASGASTSSAIRWLRVLEDRDLVIRQTDPLISGNEILELTPKGGAALRLYFRDIPK
jgi:DNA-binding MarR family transcriptional regulator